MSLGVGVGEHCTFKLLTVGEGKNAKVSGGVQVQLDMGLCKCMDKWEDIKWLAIWVVRQMC